jgi:predicted DNA-binding WGR domain protein
MMYEAEELHCTSNGHNKFYRIIRCGSLVVIRYGPRGTNGTRRVYHTSTARDAGSTFERLTRAKKKPGNSQYYIVHSFWRTIEGTGARLDAPEVENIFISNWRRNERIVSTKKNLNNHTTEWSVLEGFLASASQGDPHSIFVVQDAHQVPHAIDESRDLILAPMFPPRTTTHVRPLGVSYSDEHSLDLLDSVLALYRPGHPRPQELFSVARTLTAAT